VTIALVFLSAALAPLLRHERTRALLLLTTKLTFREDTVSARVRRSAGPPDWPINQLSLRYAYA